MTTTHLNEPPKMGHKVLKNLLGLTPTEVETPVAIWTENLQNLDRALIQLTDMWTDQVDPDSKHFYYSVTDSCYVLALRQTELVSIKVLTDNLPELRLSVKSRLGNYHFEPLVSNDRGYSVEECLTSIRYQLGEALKCSVRED